jgi:hypothetical protein
VDVCSNPNKAHIGDPDEEHPTTAIILRRQNPKPSQRLTAEKLNM